MQQIATTYLPSRPRVVRRRAYSRGSETVESRGWGSARIVAMLGSRQPSCSMVSSHGLYLHGKLAEALNEQVADLFGEIVQISHRQQYFCVEIKGTGSEWYLDWKCGAVVATRIR